MGKKNLLFIPHTPPAATLVTRGEALAQSLADQFNVHLLSWRCDPPGQTSLPGRLLSRLAGMVTSKKVYRKGNVTIIETPFLHIRRPGTKQLRRMNTAIVSGIIAKHGIDVVANQLALVNSRDLNRSHIIDIVDLPLTSPLRRYHLAMQFFKHLSSSKFYGTVSWIPWVDSTHTVVCTNCDDCRHSTEPTTWGAIKAMFR